MKHTGVMPSEARFANARDHGWRMRAAIAACILAWLIMGPQAQFARADQPPDSVSTSQALALRLVELAQNTVRDQQIPLDPHWQQCAALLEAAHRCDPAEPRYLRLLADALIQLRRTDGALEALAALRKLCPEDRAAQIQTIELHAARMQSLDQKLAYLRGVISAESVPPEVRSTAALRCWELLMHKGDSGEAGRMLDQAITLNPLNVAALAARYQTAAPTASPVQRVAMLLDIIRANPANHEILAALARELAFAGLVNDAIEWYGHAALTAQRAGVAMPRPMLLDYAAELILAERHDQAAALLDGMLAAADDEYAAIILRLLAARRLDQKEVCQALPVQARNALINRIAIVRQSMGVAGATTRPVKQAKLPLPDLAPDVEALKSPERGAARAAWLQALGDLAWFEVYFNNQPAEAEKLMKLFALVADPQDAASSTFAARMAGWILLAQGGRADEARVKLSAAAERDPLAALGLIRIFAADGADRDKAVAAGAKLLADNPAGVPAALIADALRDLGVKPAPAPAAAGIAPLLRSFPRQWLRIITNPSEFYILRAEPVRLSVQYGQPMFIRVILRNVGDFPITIGPDGVIPDGLWFDARTIGLLEGSFPNLCFERITEQIILRPRQQIVMIVRIDQGPLAAFLKQPQAIAPAVGVAVTVRNHPLPRAQTAMPGPARCFAELAPPLDRAPFRIMDSKAIDAVVAAAAGGADAQRISAIELTALLASIIHSQAEESGLRARAEPMFDVLRKAGAETDPAVRAWALFMLAFYGGAEQRPVIVQRMLADEAWQTRLLGLIGVAALPPERREQLLSAIAASDRENSVRQYAAAALELIRQPPATRPAP